MSSLSVYHVLSPDIPNKVLTHFEDIAATLGEKGIRFDRWQPTAKLQAGASQAEIIAAYQVQIGTYKAERGDVSVDVISLDSEYPQKAELRARFLKEHSHAGDETRFFVTGRGLFSLHLDDYVYAVLCEKNDLITLPAGTPHWFDAGEQPHFVAIRLRDESKGWEEQFTGDEIASRFQGLDD
ncbi:acireductone dioxygenase [Pseudomonas sp. RGM2987]|uniref:1,2-dihydroxy-3-keto-5-methylthiopentene dioxygenase n=1 Tax=Pseudomonas sp. RGM2987 TaxID=2930090 RepID=UPI001FD6B508|nr:acireductone dioxygenase [Pseudomonas sp. RGM2987]MCJ8204877.1 acireductone dioxygenase [Pseudomonas sp. RGM2987]